MAAERADKMMDEMANETFYLQSEMANEVIYLLNEMANEKFHLQNEMANKKNYWWNEKYCLVRNILLPGTNKHCQVRNYFCSYFKLK